MKEPMKFDNNVRFRSSSRLFQNSTCVFVEYTDTIQLQWFTFLSFFRNNESVYDLFNTDVIKYLSPQSLFDFYLERKYRNPLVDLLKDKETIEIETLDNLLNNLVNSEEIFFNSDVDTLVVPIINNLLAMSLVKEVVIYYPEENEFVKNDIEKKFGNSVKLVTGDIRDVLKTIPNDTTYFFSDVINVLILEELGKLDFSSVLLPVNYRYNFTDDKKDTFLIDMKHLSTKHTFKWATFRIA